MNRKRFLATLGKLVGGIGALFGGAAVAASGSRRVKAGKLKPHVWERPGFYAEGVCYFPGWSPDKLTVISDGVPVEGLDCFVQNEGGEWVQVGRTDERGRYSFLDPHSDVVATRTGPTTARYQRWRLQHVIGEWDGPWPPIRDH